MPQVGDSGDAEGAQGQAEEADGQQQLGQGHEALGGFFDDSSFDWGFVAKAGIKKTDPAGTLRKAKRLKDLAESIGK